MKFVNNIYLIFTLIVFPTLASASNDQQLYTANFPDVFHELPSPDTKLTLINKDPDEHQESHNLLIRYNGNSEKQKIVYTYYRHVFVGWSPDSKFISITDFKESTNTICILYEIQSDRKIDLFDRAIQSNESIARILRNEHAYLECSNWLSPSDVEIKITAWGSNNPNGIEDFFVYNIKNGVMEKK